MQHYCYGLGGDLCGIPSGDISLVVRPMSLWLCRIYKCYIYEYGDHMTH